VCIKASYDGASNNSYDGTEYTALHRPRLYSNIQVLEKLATLRSTVVGDVFKFQGESVKNFVMVRDRNIPVRYLFV
jgi:hypothetical protein